MNDVDDRAGDLLKEHLAAREAGIDGQALLREVQRRLVQEGATPHAARPVRRVPRSALVLKAAAAILVVGLLGYWIQPWGGQGVYAATRTIAAEHRHGGDRLYRVTFEADPGTRRPIPRLFSGALSGKTMDLVTRGDRFFVRPTGDPKGLVFGQDGEQTGLWIAIPLKLGLRVGTRDFFEAIVRDIVDLRSFHLQRMLDSLVLEYDLDMTDEDGVRTIEGRPRPDAQRPFASRVRLWTAAGSSVVEGMTVDLALSGDPIGRLDYRLAGDAEVSEDAYRLTGHVDGELILEGISVREAIRLLVEHLR